MMSLRSREVTEMVMHSCCGLTSGGGHRQEEEKGQPGKEAWNGGFPCRWWAVKVKGPRYLPHPTCSMPAIQRTKKTAAPAEKLPSRCCQLAICSLKGENDL